MNDSYFPYIFKIIDKLHIHGISLVKNTDCKYFMRFKVIDYSKLDLNKLIQVAQKAETILGYILPGQVMHAGPRLKKYSVDNVPTATGG